jgi:hypothetical protein
MAADDKCLAQINKSRTGGKATKEWPLENLAGRGLSQSATAQAGTWRANGIGIHADRLLDEPNLWVV